MLQFELAGVEVGTAEYEEGPTGCTVFSFPEGAACAVDIRGGSPGVIEPPEYVDAICLSGGSLPGLEAAAGVVAGLLERRAYATGWDDIPVVGGAVIFDFRIRDNAIHPDRELGRAAFLSARPGSFPLGARGAGRNATVGKGLGLDHLERGGQGGAVGTAGAARIGVFTVVNAVGAIVDRDGRVVRGNRDPRTGERLHYADAIRERLASSGDEPVTSDTPSGNTTLTVVITDARVALAELRQLGRQVHASMSRAIQPFHAMRDGDVLFSVSTGAAGDTGVDLTALGAIGADLAWDAVLASVPRD